MAPDINKDLGTTEVEWNLTDLYSGYDDPVIEKDISSCQDEAKAIKASKIQDENTFEVVAREWHSKFSYNFV